MCIRDRVGEHRTLAEGERDTTFPLGDHLLADHVGRHQVGRELDAGELHVEGGGDALRKQCLGHTGNALEQDVAVHQELSLIHI